MKISYNWLKWYIPDAPSALDLKELINKHLTEVESLVPLDKDGSLSNSNEIEDWIFDLNILPNRAHDLLSHSGVAREIASFLDIPFVDPIPNYKIPEIQIGEKEELNVTVESPNVRRYMARIVRNIKVSSSPEWVVKHLESIGQKSINNIVDAANIVMFDCGQPIHCFDLDKLSSNKIIVRNAKIGEEMTTLDNKNLKLKDTDLVIADEKNILALAGIKGGKIAQVDENTKNIIIEIANFHPSQIRKTARGFGIFTDAMKRFENDLSPSLCDFAMTEMSALLVEYGNDHFEKIIDIYREEQIEKKILFNFSKISKILGIEIKKETLEDILKRYDLKYIKENDDQYLITIPFIRLDLNIEEDIVEEIGRIIGYDKIIPQKPNIKFTPKVNDKYAKIVWAKNQLILNGYNEVMTYSFADKGEVEVLESASDKKFLRSNLIDGLRESIEKNTLNAPFLNLGQIKIFEIGTVFKENKEEIVVAYGDKKKINELPLEEFCELFSTKLNLEMMNLELLADFAKEKKEKKNKFDMWSVYPFIVRDISLWVPKSIESEEILNIIKQNTNELVIQGPYLFDSFEKEDKISYAFRMIFQSFNKTLTDKEVEEIMEKITSKLKENPNWQIR